LRMTGDSRAADELEISTWNAVMGAQHPSGRWWTYNTPMDGDRKASAHEIVFQARAGSPELNCCSVNGPRGLGAVGEWGVMVGRDVLAVNWFGAGEWRVVTSFAGKVRLVQETNYPSDGRVVVKVSPEREAKFAVWVRVPSWSRKTEVRVNGEAVDGVAAGKYAVLERVWKEGDRVEVGLDMGPWHWVGEKECTGTASVYWGPILLAYDPRFDSHDPRKLPRVDLRKPLARVQDGPETLMRWRAAAADGGKVTLCDFASAGAAGNPYVSWLPCEAAEGAAFSRENPWRLVT
jgi:DUF1680 family protein